MNAPVLRQMVRGPVSAAGARAGIARVKALPARVLPRRAPDDLRVRPHEIEAAPALELFSVGGIEHLIILPLIGFPHGLSAPVCLFAGCGHRCACGRGRLSRFRRFRRLRRLRRTARPLRRLGRLDGVGGVNRADLLLVLGVIDEVCILVDFPILIINQLADFFNRISIGLFTVFVGNFAAFLADFDHSMAGALLCGRIFIEQTHRHNAVAAILAHVLLAGLDGLAATVSADGIVADVLITNFILIYKHFQEKFLRK